MKPFIKSMIVTLLLIPIFTGLAEGKKDLPNFVIINLDDSGYGDFSPLGKPDYPTPNVDRLAKQGCVLTNFHVPQSVCTAS